MEPGRRAHGVLEAPCAEELNEIDGLRMRVGCFTVSSMQLESGKTSKDLKPCAGFDGVNIFGAPTFSQYTLRGAILIGAVGLSSLGRSIAES